MRNEALFVAASELWSALDEIIRIYGDVLNDYDADFERENLETDMKFSRVIVWLDGLARHVDKTAMRYAKPEFLGPPWDRKKRKKTK